MGIRKSGKNEGRRNHKANTFFGDGIIWRRLENGEIRRDREMLELVFFPLFNTKEKSHKY
jgi:hypothetical protein